MSNADNCAYCGRVRASDWHRVTSNPGTHAFVGAAPQPSGDDAMVRELARAEAESIATRWVPAHMTARQGMVDDITASLVRYRLLGREEGAREERAEAYREVCDIRCTSHGNADDGCPCLAVAEQAIARRGSEGI